VGIFKKKDRSSDPFSYYTGSLAVSIQPNFFQDGRVECLSAVEDFFKYKRLMNWSSRDKLARGYRATQTQLAQQDFVQSVSI
jgi:hypothetical protein